MDMLFYAILSKIVKPVPIHGINRFAGQLLLQPAGFERIIMKPAALNWCSFFNHRSSTLQSLPTTFHHQPG